ncbi:NnrU family protein [Aromatoleum petrolei]|nr:NnrU family protein [Aromatoleum petrolei]
MTALILGLLFFSTHSARIFAEDNRAQYIAHYGRAKWKLAYPLASAIGLGLIVWGYGAVRLDPLVLWAPATWTRHLAAVLTLPAFILIAAYVPGTRLRAKLGHPVVIGVQLWAVAHLLANGALADLLVFGCFLVWAIASFVAARRRDGAQRVVRGDGALGWDAVAVGGGAGVWFVFARHLHGVLFGVVPFG